MKALALIMALVAAPLHAQEGEVEDGADLLSRAAEMLLRGLLGEVEPAFRELRDRIGDLDAYHPPEILPNGDIIIRRKQPEDDEALPVDPEEGIDI